MIELTKKQKKELKGKFECKIDFIKGIHKIQSIKEMNNKSYGSKELKLIALGKINCLAQLMFDFDL